MMTILYPQCILLLVHAVLFQLLLCACSSAVSPESCLESPYILMGEHSQWRDRNGNLLKCNFTELVSLDTYRIIPVDRDSDGVLFSSSGDYNYWCPVANNPTGKFSVVTAQHKITLCDICNEDLVVLTGDVVYWTLVDITDCNLQLVNTSCSGDIVRDYGDIQMINPGLQEGYYFQQEGVYQLVCSGKCQPLATITVLENATSNITEDLYNLYSKLLNSSNETCTSSPAITHIQLIYTHAGIMAMTFGFIIPLGALVANHKKYLPHMTFQIFAMLLAIVGLILAIVYKEVNNERHFQHLHSIIGLVIIIACVLIQPGLKLLHITPIKNAIVKVWHKRIGISIVFFGLSNIFLGFLVLNTTPLYIKVLYGIWVILVIAVYLIFGAIKSDEQQTKKLEEEELFGFQLGCASCYKGWSREDKISLESSIGPSKLTKDLINETNFVQIRKKSVDVLEMTVNTQLSNENGTNKNIPRRKISNVHFGPVAIAANLTPMAPDTPQINATNFGFGEKNTYVEDVDTDEDSNSEEKEDESESEDERKSNNDIRDSLCSLSSIPSNGGSLRITRHSSRAHTKVSEIFQRSNSFRKPNHIDAPSITIRSESPLQSSIRSSPGEIEKRDSPSDEEGGFPRVCPLHTSGSINSGPLHQRRMRKNAINLQAPDIEKEMLLPRTRSLSRSPSFTRKKREMLVDNTLRSVMQMSDDAIVSANACGELVFWSSGAVKMFGYTPGEAIGSSLQMIMPERFKEKHQNGVNKKTEYAMEYIKKHHVAPEEQKHARLYSVCGISKSGKEFPVEVVVSSFVIEGEIFYTGIITEVTNREGLTRQLSASSLSSEIEIREKQQKAMAIGAQMKIVHKLRSAEHMTKRELHNILETSLTAAEFEVPKEDIERMVDGILQAADPEETRIITFIELIDLLAKHRLYISDSGLIAKYGQTKGVEGNLNAMQRISSKISCFLTMHTSFVVWLSLYVILNIILLLAGVLSTSKQGWSKWSYGTGPVLSMNSVIILLPMMRGLINIMRGSIFLNKVLPLMQSLIFHVIIAGGLTFWSAVHLFTHFGSFAFDDKSNSTSKADNFVVNLKSHINPLITGLVMILILLIMSISSINPLRKMCRFVGFHCLHWIGLSLFYLLIIIHGVNNYNPSFWKWLLVVGFVFVLERLYSVLIMPRYSVGITKAFPYDETSRVLSVELDKPTHFKSLPGQYITVNIPEIGYFDWQSCAVSSSNKEQKLKVYLPHTGSVWLKESYQRFKTNPLNPKPKNGEIEVIQPSLKATISGPFGPGVNILFDYRVAMLVCGGDGPHTCRNIIQRFLEYRRSTSCHCGCHPALTKLYFIWVTPSGNDYEWFTDFLSDIIEDKHVQRYLDIRIFLTNINSPPDELASALLHLALKTGGPALSVRRPSQPQLSKLYSNTSYGVPDFESLLDFVSMQQGTASDQETECGIFTIGTLPYTMVSNLRKYTEICSRKRGPLVQEDKDDSPYRKQSSPKESTPPESQEWHITFKLSHLIT